MGLKTLRPAIIVSAIVLTLQMNYRICWAGSSWPAFRGDGTSQVTDENPPLSWELRGNSLGSWTIRLPGYGQSSPVIWGDAVYVTSVSGEEKEHLHIMRVALQTGELVWQKDFSGTQRVKDSDAVSRGAPTPIVDASRLYAVFESGDIIALTHDGEAVWERSFVKDYGEIQGPHGYSSSPVLVDDVLTLQVSHTGPSYVLGLEAVSGKTLWKTNHPSQTGWSSPAVYSRAGSSVVIVSTAGSVRGYAPRTGKELWTIDGLSGNSTATPTIAGDLVVIGAGVGGGRRRPRPETSRDSSTEQGDQPENVAEKHELQGSCVLKLDSKNPLATPELIWNSTKVSCGYASPVVIDNSAYFVNKVGVVQCVDLKTGEIFWQHRLPGQDWASPCSCSGKLVCFGKDGTVTVLGVGDQPEEISESQISSTDMVYGVAVSDDSWVIRTGRGLTRVTNPK